MLSGKFTMSEVFVMLSTWMAAKTQPDLEL